MLDRIDRQRILLMRGVILLLSAYGPSQFCSARLVGPGVLGLGLHLHTLLRPPMLLSHH
eukprot:SAG31_NODE_37247_length_306_cov_0.550725_1_plen_58_part_10